MRLRYAGPTLAVIVALMFSGCGKMKSATEVCSTHGGINTATYEDDGDVTCMDGYEYEGDGDHNKSKTKKKIKKVKR